ncbi:MAG: stage III sporulation protein AF, partial [Cellulosilyticaceae bacterium]
GFIVIFTLLGPIIDFVTGTSLVPGDTVSQYINYYQAELGQEVTYSTYEDEVEKQKEGMLAIYGAQLEEQTRNWVEKNVEVDVVGIEVIPVMEESGFGVESVALEVAYKDSDGIGFGIGSKSESIVLDQDVLEKQIKNCLNTFYNWDNTNIYITVQEN